MKSLGLKHLMALTVVMFVAALGIQPASAVAKPWIGIYMQDVNADLAEAFGLKVDKGVVVNDIAKGSPAAEAGLQPKDVILAWNGKAIDNAASLTDMVGDAKVGDKVDLSVNRDGKTMNIDLTVGERKDSDFSFGDNSSQGRSHRELTQAMKTTGIGVSLQSLTSQLGDYFGVKDGDGALITEVMKDTPAEKAGLKAGDVIVKVDGDKVESPGDVTQAIREKQKGDQVDLVVLRDKSEKNVSLQVDEIQSFGMADPYETYMQYFHPGGPNGTGRAPSMMYQWNDNNSDMQQQLKDMQGKLEDMQRKLDQLQSKMK